MFEAAAVELLHCYPLPIQHLARVYTDVHAMETDTRLPPTFRSTSAPSTTVPER